MFASNKSAAPSGKLFVEDVFSTYLYTGNGSTQTINNGIDLAGKGGLVWNKARSAAQGHALTDTVRGAGRFLQTNSVGIGFGPSSDFLSAFNSNGFSLGSDNTQNGSGTTYASWTFREAPKFFDVVTYTGTGSFFRDLSHSLGVAPGFIVVKRTDTTSNWWTYHRGVLGSINGYLNLTNAFNNIGYVDPSPTPAATFRVFNTGAGDDLNVSGATYVAYLYAHDTSSTGLIQCGSFTTDPSTYGFDVTLGWEPQWVMIKRTDSTGNWMLYDNMRGMPVGPSGYGIELYPNTAGAEALGFLVAPNATGFSSPYYVAPSANFIYIAIRRGPMRTPTLGTSVFAPVTRTGTGATVYTTTSGFAPDSVWMDARSQSGKGPGLFDRLRGLPQLLQTTTTSSEVTNAGYIRLMGNTGYTSNADAYYNTSSQTFVDWIFRRAPGFFDEVCYTGTGANRTINHNLGVAPELMIVKRRDGVTTWITYSQTLGIDAFLTLQSSNASGTGGAVVFWNSTAPTSSVISLGEGGSVNISNGTYVAYLFASCPGVSKVGTYTGNGSSQTINCGFAAGARFVMIKRTDSTGDWYVWDTARGIVAANDPHLSLNTTAAEVTTDDTIDTNSSGFVVNQDAATNVNVNAATYIFLAIA